MVVSRKQILVFGLMLFSLFLSSLLKASSSNESNDLSDAKSAINMNINGYSLDYLPVITNDVQVLQFSSRNKTGFNGDSDHYLYEDDKGDTVVFDATGPGCIKSFWGTDVQGITILKFYFDDEED